MSSMAFLGAEWFARAAETLEAVQLVVPGATARIQYQATGQSCVRWYQIIEDGSCAAWRLGDIEGADVEIRWSQADAFEILSGNRTGAEASLATTIVDHRPDRTYIGPPPPLDIAHEPALAGMRRLEGADLVVWTELKAAPFGDTKSTWIFRDGQLADVVAGFVGEPGVEFFQPFRQDMLERSGEMSTLEALQFGGVSGSIETLTMLGGIVQSPAWRRAMIASVSGRAPMALAALGEVTADDAYREAVVGLMAGTQVGQRNG